jgi:nucleoside-diphosphate-sugar epimerase
LVVKEIKVVDEVLVTGANGFVGSHICEALLAAGFRVRALVRKSSDLTNIKELPINLAYGDICMPATLASAVQGVVAVINNAGLVKANNPDDFLNVNLGGTENILAASRVNPKLTKLIHISSTAACGPAPDSNPINEDYPPGPLTAYGRSKLEAEKVILAHKDAIPSIILRPCAVYGPRDKEMLSFFKAIKLGIRPHFGRGENYINFTYVKDLAQAVVKSITASVPSGSIYFVAEKKSYAYSQAGTIIGERLGKKTIDVRVPNSILRLAGKVSGQVARLRGKPSVFTEDKVREIVQKYWLFDTSKIERELDFVGTDFVVGVAETIRWYKENGWL